MTSNTTAGLAAPRPGWQERKLEQEREQRWAELERRGLVEAVALEREVPLERRRAWLREMCGIYALVGAYLLTSLAALGIGLALELGSWTPLAVWMLAVLASWYWIRRADRLASVLAWAEFERQFEPQRFSLLSVPGGLPKVEALPLASDGLLWPKVREVRLELRRDGGLFQPVLAVGPEGVAWR